MKMNLKTKRVRLDSAALAQIPHSGMLAMLPRAFDGSVSLLAEPPVLNYSARSFASDGTECEAELTEEPSTDTDVASMVAIVAVIGPIAQRAEYDMCAYVDGYDAIQARFKQAHASEADAILAVIGSPGGDAAGCFEAVRAIRAMGAESGKPVVCYFDEQAASAAYALSTVADESHLPESGEAGSIGVLCVHVDQTAALEKAGLKVKVIRSRAHKAEGSSLEPLSKDAEARMQARVDELDRQFAALVVERRPGARKAIDMLAGEVAGGQKAVDLGLADAVSSFAVALDRAHELGGKRRQRMKTQQQLEAENLALEARASAAEGQSKALIEATEATSFAAALGKIEAGKTAVKQLAIVEAEAKTLRETQAAAAKVAAVNEVLAEGSVAVDAPSAGPLAGRVTEGNRERLAAFGAKYGVDDLRAHVAELPVHAAYRAPAEQVRVAGAAGAARMSEADRKVAKQLGLSEKDYQAAQAAEETR